MHWFLMAAIALAAAAALWSSQALTGRGGPACRTASGGEGEAFRRWAEDPAITEGLARAVEALGELMAHPELGGPGFLTLRLPQPGEDGLVTAAAQYPNIREAMYCRVVRRELDRDALLAAGVPEALLALEPQFETDSGGVVVVSVQAVPMGELLAEQISGRTDRQAALRLLAGRLGERFPRLEVRPFGSELLLTPVREESRSPY
ncbi:MAG: hypothetical protein K2O45_17340 [Oscillospiraceae bacterium]|nr:hypothetical protein [Oscillospiraceae bacterium]